MYGKSAISHNAKRALCPGPTTVEVADFGPWFISIAHAAGM